MLSADQTNQDEQPGARVNTWLRRHLGRRLTVALVAPVPRDDVSHRLADALTKYEEILVFVLPAEQALGTEWLVALDRIDPEIVLVAESAGTGATPDERGEDRRLRALLDDLERRGLLDRAFVALVGANVTRERARHLGFEDGFAAGTPLHEIAAVLSREGVAVEERRQRGSSPPCYL